MLNIGSWEADAVGYWARRHHGEVGGSVGIPSTQWVFTLCLLALLLCYFVCLNSRVSDVFVLWFSQPFSLSVNQNTFVLLQTNQRCACFFLLCENNASKCCIFNVSSSSFHFLRATAVPADTAKRLSAMAILSVCPSICLSVMTRYRFKPRWDRDSGSSPNDSLESVVSHEVIWCHWVRGFPSNECIKQGYPPPLEIVILPLLTHLAWKRLQIDTDLLRIIASTADELSSGMNIDDLEWPWTPKIGVFSEFLAILGCNTHFKTELRRNRSR